MHGRTFKSTSRVDTIPYILVQPYASEHQSNQYSVSSVPGDATSLLHRFPQPGARSPARPPRTHPTRTPTMGQILEKCGIVEAPSDPKAPVRPGALDGSKPLSICIVGDGAVGKTAVRITFGLADMHRHRARHHP